VHLIFGDSWVRGGEIENGDEGEGDGLEINLVGL
jgi:hypothetical protein